MAPVKALQPLVSDTRCVVFQCRAEAPRLAAHHLFGPIRQ